MTAVKKTYEFKQTPTLYKVREGYRLKGEARLRPLPYLLIDNQSQQSWAYTVTDASASRLYTDLREKAYTVAYDRFFAKTKTQAALMVNVAEAKASFDMIHMRASQLARAAHFFATRKFRAGLLALGVDPTGGFDRQKDSRKVPADMWLEYSFGWSPIVQDINACVEILGKGIYAPIRLISGKAKMLSHEEVSYKANLRDGWRFDGVGFVKLSGRVTVMCDNIVRYNELGLLNPALVIWDRVPFSFVVDWFLPVNKYLSSFTNEYGIEVDRIVDTTFAKCSSEFQSVGDGGQLFFSHFKRMDRTTPDPLPLPSFLSRMHMDLDPWKAATSVALLVQNLQRLSSAK